MRVLVSGFGPFLEEKVNPTERIVQFVNSCDSHAREWSKLDVRGVVLPVVFDEAFVRLEKERLLFKPDAVLSFGLAGGRTHVEIEQIATNFPDPRLATYPTTLPSEALIADLTARGIPARPSYTAGTYVCNCLFFQMQERLRYTRVMSGFIHVPRLAEGREEGSVTETAWSWEKFEASVDSILATISRLGDRRA